MSFQRSLRRPGVGPRAPGDEGETPGGGPVGQTMKMLKTALKGFAMVMTLLFLFLWASGILGDVHSMLTVSDEESSGLFMEQERGWDEEVRP